MASPPLRARAAAAKTDTNGAPGTEMARTNGNGGAANLAALIAKYRPEFETVLPKHLNIDRLLRIATTVMRQTPDLQLCTPETFLGALMTCSQLGLEPGPLGEAYLLPFKDSNLAPNQRVCTFVIGYKGLIKLAYQSGQIASFAAETIFENDRSAIHYGSARRIEHDRTPLGVPRGTPIGWYALAGFKDGGEAFVVLDRPEVEAFRARSRAAHKGPWVTDYNAMAKKTCVRQLAKWIPQSPELAAALGQDGTARTDMSREALQAPGEYIEGELAADDPPPGVDPATGQIAGPPADAESVAWPTTAQPGTVDAEADVEDPPGWDEGQTP